MEKKPWTDSHCRIVSAINHLKFRQVYERKHSIQQTVTSKLGSLALFKDEDEDDISTAGGGLLEIKLICF